ncbi:SDR family NAD(P)-dependent oxidoreductase [Streptomyces sp. NPDC059224]|uniref:SDR family NAD(P)-dependent oxidoreductase n=1 Tax=Streptomyces sp. NPDC059224 TaxID=3346775 RepID=UPI0036CD43B1
MTKQFADRSVLITGGGSGIGRASALALAAEGALVTVAGRTVETLQETVSQIEARGGSARYVVADITDESQVEMAVRTAADGTGRLDLAVNNAGYDGEYQLTTEYSTEMLDHMIALNVRGVFLSMKYELQHMVAQGAGAIVNMSSGAGLVGVAGFSGYTATKAAEIAMTKSSALEAAPHGIRINAVCPGLVDTPMIATLDDQTRKSLADAHPLGRIARAEEIADAVVWLCSGKSSFVTGIALPVDGGYSVP